MVDDIDSGTDAKQRREILKRKENLMQEYRRKQRAEYWREEVINTDLRHRVIFEQDGPAAKGKG